MGFCIITVITGLMGLCMYALYHDCDPEKNKVHKYIQVNKSTEIISISRLNLRYENNFMFYI